MGKHFLRLDCFEGPLDLLLYLIKSQNFDILELPVSKITDQYIQYIDLMRELKLELAAEYMLMAATLAEIKSKLLDQANSEISLRQGRKRREKFLIKKAIYILDLLLQCTFL